MKVTIDRKEMSTGLLFKKTFFEIRTTVQFTAEEQAVIRERNLGDEVILDRPPPAHHVANLSDERLQTGVDLGHYKLHIKDLLKGPDSYTTTTPVQAQVYEQELMGALKDMKQAIELSAGPAERSTSFEL